MEEDAHGWDPYDWEDHVAQLLDVRYGSDFIPIPAAHGGDFGLDGFSTDGNVYQCYAPQGRTTKERYTGTRSKLKDDVPKLISNKDKLVKLFPDGYQVRRWVLYVPKSESAPLLQYAKELSDEIRRAKLPHVAADFMVVIKDESSLAVERATLVEKGVTALRLTEQFITDDDVAAHDLEGDLVSTLERKLAKTPMSPGQQADFQRESLKNYIRGENILQELRERYSVAFNKVETVKARQEEFLVSHLAADGLGAMESMKSARERFRSDLSRTVRLQPFHAEALEWWALSSWLFHCRMDFRRPHEEQSA